MTLGLVGCPSRDVCDDITQLNSIVSWNLSKVTKCPSLASSIVHPVSQCPSHCECAIPLRTLCVCERLSVLNLLNTVVHAVSRLKGSANVKCGLIWSSWCWREMVMNIINMPIQHVSCAWANGIVNIVLCSYSLILRTS